MSHITLPFVNYIPAYTEQFVTNLQINHCASLIQPFEQVRNANKTNKSPIRNFSLEAFHLKAIPYNEYF